MIPRLHARVGLASGRLACALLLGLALGSPWAGAAGPLPLTLTDPSAERRVVLEPGAPVMHLVFFATWCPPCIDEFDRLADLDARWEESGYRLVLIAVPTRHTAERLARFGADRRLPGELLFDAEGTAMKALGAESLPTHLLLDADGKIVLRGEALGEDVIRELETRMREWERRR